MSNIIGIHMLTAYPPSNPNRDEDGQPKTAVVGGVKRQRISSQCIKRTWRMSEIMKGIEVNFSTRTRSIGARAEEKMIDGGVSPKLARTYATYIAEAYGSLNKKIKGPPENSEMVVLGHEEVAIVDAIVDAIINPQRNENTDAVEAVNLLISLEKKPPPKGKAQNITETEVGESNDESEDKKPKEKRVARLNELLQRSTTSTDVAMFGRMRASTPKLSVDASIYVSHPLTTGKAVIDGDFWTSVDDLNESSDTGAGGMGDVEFGSGTFYTYVEVNLDALAKNLGGNNANAKDALLKLIDAMAQTSPSGHKTTFNSSVRASYMRIEIGEPSGNLFCKAFEKPIMGTEESIVALKKSAEDEAAVYDLKQTVFELTANDREQSLKSTLSKIDSALV